ncbi:MAG: FG-GAP-like repeat-containing protein [Planctomycetota bacterium]|nr:FG-GAP-like repeat-containing protein [Planctomycetota bacterium]
MALLSSMDRHRGAAVLLASLGEFGGGAFGQTAFDFAPPVVYEIGFDAYPNSVEAGDLNQDGFIDLVLAARNAEGHVIVMFGESDGTFGPPSVLDLTDQTNWALIRDLNGDGKLDLAISHRSGLGRVSVLLGNGDGSFQEPVDYLVGREPNPIFGLDLDSDADLDIVVLNTTSATVSVLRNNGDATFALAQDIAVLSTASPRPTSFWADAGDLDGDGFLDLAVVSIGPTVVSILMNTGEATFSPAVQVAVANDGALSGVTVADFDRDGDLDIVTKAGGLTSNASLLVLLNDGTGTFHDVVETSLLPELGGSPWYVASADFDGDRHVDLAWGSNPLSTQAVGLLRNEGNRAPSFATPEQTFVLGGFPRVVLPVDIDGDRDIDLVVANIGLHNVVILENQTPQGGAASATAPPFVFSKPRLPSWGSGSGARWKQKRTVDAAPVGGFVGDRNADGRIDATDLTLAIAGVGEAAELSSTGRSDGPVATGGAQDAAGPGRTTAGNVAGSFEACGEPDAGDCYEPNGTPGCDDEACCAEVCDINPICCSKLGWDETCALIAGKICEEQPCPGKGSCFQPHDTPGCDNEECCSFICAIDGFCCAGPWDPICAGHAAMLCDVQRCELPACPDGATPEPEGIQCFDRINDGCNLDEPAFTPISCGEIVCGTAWTLFIRDTDWYQITLDEPAEITWTVTSEFPSQLSIVTGRCDTSYTVAAAAYGGACRAASASLAVQPGTYYLFVAPGTDVAPIHHGIGCLDDRGELIEAGAFTSRYTATVSCRPLSPCPADLDGDGVVGILDLLSLLAAWGTDPGGPPDLDGDGTVGILDLLALVANWGPCA